MKKLLYLLFAITTIVGCSNGDDINNDQPSNKPSEETILFVESEPKYVLDTRGGDFNIEIQTNVDVLITTSPHSRWLGYKWVENSRGVKTRTMNFFAGFNNNLKDLETTVTIQGGNISYSFKVKQEGKEKYNKKLEKIKKALIALYEATDGDNWTNNTNWCTDAPLYEWYGVYMNGSGLPVRHVSLSDNNLNGYIPEEIGDFEDELLSLSLSYNKLSGELPKSMSKLTKLEELYLYRNQLEGEVATIINKMTNLHSLSLSQNNFSGNLPEVNDNMLAYGAQENNFTGGIPASHIKAFEPNPNCDPAIFNTEYGHRYDISYNKLEGEVPAEMVNHKSWTAHWREILPQQKGYGFPEYDLPAPDNVVQCFDDSYLDLAEEYQNNKYTLFFRWDADCPWSNIYTKPIYKLYEKYKDQGLKLIVTTYNKYDMDYLAPLMPMYEDIKIFWEMVSGQGGIPEDVWNNNPYVMNGAGPFYLFRSGITPLFHIVDNSGNIIYFTGEGTESIPQYHPDRDDIYDFVANLFGDKYYEPPTE